MPLWGIITLIVLVVLIAGMVVLYFVGNNMQKKQLAQREQVLDAAQPMTMMIIDKKYMKMKDAKLPKIVMEQAPKRYQNSKLPIVKAKVGPQIMTLIADDAIYEEIPTKGEVKAMVSGIYIVGVKALRNKKQPVEEETGGKRKKKKESFGAKMRKQQAEYQKMYAEEEKQKALAKANKDKEKKKKEEVKKIMK